MTYPVVKDLARDGIPVKLSCRVLGFSRQAYYQWLAEPVSEREWSDAHAANAVLDAHADDPEFGYRFLADELRERGLSVSDHQVLKACRLVKVRCCHSIRRGSGKRPGPAVHDDLVRREFRAEKPNQLWLTDISEHWAGDSKLYLCAVKDVFSNRIVGWSSPLWWCSGWILRWGCQALSSRAVSVSVPTSLPVSSTGVRRQRARTSRPR